MSAPQDRAAEFIRLVAHELGSQKLGADTLKAIEREGLKMWDAGMADGVDMACQVIELVAADQGPQHLHALHRASEAIRATHRRLMGAHRGRGVCGMTPDDPDDPQGEAVPDVGAASPRLEDVVSELVAEVERLRGALADVAINQYIQEHGLAGIKPGITPPKDSR